MHTPQLTALSAFAIKTARVIDADVNSVRRAYSAVAQWQSIRLLTEGL